VIFSVCAAVGIVFKCLGDNLSVWESGYMAEKVET